MNSWTEIKQPSEQYGAWVAYFRRLGWMPYSLRTIEQNKNQSWTAPCEWPPQMPPLRLTGGIVG